MMKTEGLIEQPDQRIQSASFDVEDVYGTFDIELADGKTIEHAPRNSLSDVAPGATPGEHVHGLTEGHSGAGGPGELRDRDASSNKGPGSQSRRR